MKQPRPIITQPDDTEIRHIALTKGQVAIVDAADYDWLMQWTWYARYDPKMGCYYAGRVLKQSEGGNGKTTRIEMHDAILQPQPGYLADHIHGKTLDNRRSQLREVTNRQNLCNTKTRRDNKSGVKGVTWQPERNAWYAHIYVSGRMKNLGRHKKFEVAVAVRKAAEEKYHGEYARKSTT